MTDLQDLKQVTHFINGRLTQPSERQQAFYNSYNGAEQGKVSLASDQEVESAVAAAKEALAKWSATPALKRARIFFRYKELLEQNSERCAEILAIEHGKVFNDALGEIQRGIEIVEYVCGCPDLLKADYSLGVANNVDSYVLNQPVGVCVGITPFNFPYMVPLWMFPVAIACGNTFVLKPSEKDPTCPIILAQLLQQAGLPDGVFNVVNGDKQAVDSLLRHEDVAAISFVGSTAVAQYVYQTGCQHGKRVQALGGAKNHMIVMPDADITQASQALMGSAYGSAGERCMAISVAVAIGDETGDKLIKQLQPSVEVLRIGPGLGSGKNNDMGPLISKEHRERVLQYVDIGVSEGAQLLVDGRGFSCSDYPAGYFVGGCLFDKVKAHMRIYREEIFGPVLCVMRVHNLDEAIKLVNDHEYGNGTSIFTKDGTAAHEFSHRIQCGMVGINVPIPVPVAYHSFGGWKKSIFGSNNIYGPEGIRFYLRPKTITARWQPETESLANFNFPVNN